MDHILTLIVDQRFAKYIMVQADPFSIYRLRVGQSRVIFDRDDEVKIISIEKIKPRGDAYK